MCTSAPLHRLNLTLHRIPGPKVTGGMLQILVVGELGKVQPGGPDAAQLSILARVPRAHLNVLPQTKLAAGRFCMGVQAGTERSSLWTDAPSDPES